MAKVPSPVAVIDDALLYLVDALSARLGRHVHLPVMCFAISMCMVAGCLAMALAALPAVAPSQPLLAIVIILCGISLATWLHHAAPMIPDLRGCDPTVEARYRVTATRAREDQSGQRVAVTALTAILAAVTHGVDGPFFGFANGYAVMAVMAMYLRCFTSARTTKGDDGT